MESGHCERIVWLDWMRVIACLMVMTVHCIEPYYLGGEGAWIRSASDARWVAFFGSFVRACVPLFVVTSSYLLFPLSQGPKAFFRRRASRLLIPFVLWSIFYALTRGDSSDNLKGILLNFNYAAGHLWFVYMIVGLYLIMPLLSPWAERAGKKELLAYLGIWFFTTLIPLFRAAAAGSDTPVIYGPTGIPNLARYPLWGEASWNAYGMFYYLSGFVGYLLLGLYFRKFVGELSWKKTISIALPCFLVGFSICCGGFLRLVNGSCHGVFPVEGLTGLAALWETTWCNDTAGVALLVISWVLLFKKFRSRSGLYDRVVVPVSKASYGMYLGHMAILPVFSGLFMGVLPTPAAIPLSALCTFSCTALFAVSVRRIPKVGRFIIG